MPEYLSTAQLDGGSYASVEDLEDFSIPENASHDYSTRAKVKCLKAAFGIVNGELGQRFETPLKRWSETVVWAQCEIAYSMLANKRGHDPEAKTEKTVAKRRQDALDWLNSAKEYQITPDPVLQQMEPDQVGIMKSDLPRGWHGERTLTAEQRQYGRGAFFTDR